jgi:RNA polymerase sigma-70 factor, ECF subfamily
MVSDSFTHIYEQARQGSPGAAAAVYELSFGRLRGVAAALLSHDPSERTLQPTALVNELFLKVCRFQTRILGREHFFRLCSRGMRRLLVDSGRARRAAKRTLTPGAMAGLIGAVPGSLDPALGLSVQMAFEKLQRVDPQAAETVWLREVEGFTIEEVSRRQSRESWKVRVDHEFALQWMAKHLRARS